MTVFQAELKYYLRSPIIWLIAAISAFLSAWSFLLAIELFTSMQVKFAGMTDAPTLVQGIIFPVLAAQAKLMLIIVPIIAGLSFSRLQNYNGWTMVNVYAFSELHFIKQKYLALLLIALIFIAPMSLAILILSFMTEISLMPVLYGLIGLLLLLMWMLALCMYISSLISNSGFAILMCLFVLLMLWVFSISVVDSHWGKNWIQVISPNYHFSNFLSSYLSFSSILYFGAGIFFSLWATKIRIIHKRYLLS